METFINTLLIIHASLGGVSLIAGSISMMTKKGSKNHKQSGKVFSIALLIASILAIPVTLSESHNNLFLFLIAIFTIYMILSGNRALRNKFKSEPPNRVDYIISGVMAAFALALIAIGSYSLMKNNGGILFIFFGIVSLILTYGDYIYFKSGFLKKGLWLRQHIGRIMGAYIAAITAFLLTALQSDSVIVWMAPTIVGTLFIIYWSRKVKHQFNRTTESV